MGVGALSGSASAQSVESTASAPVPTGLIVSVPQPVCTKKSESTSVSRSASKSSGRSTPARPGSQAAKAP